MNVKRNRSLNTVVTMLGLVLIGVAINDQLRKPAEQRTWQGKVFGFPYDLRIPTFKRVRNTIWNKNSFSVLVPTAFGVGWSINFYPLLHPANRG